MSKLVKIGDVIKLEKGMKVNAMIPCHFQFFTISDHSLLRDIVIGEIFVSKKQTKEQYMERFSDYIAKFFPKELEAQIKDKEFLTFVESLNLKVTYGSTQNPEILDTSTFAGEYLVYNISVLQPIMSFEDVPVYMEFEDEEVANNNEIPPCMQTLHCQKVDNPEIKVEILQSNYESYFLEK